VSVSCEFCVLSGRGLFIGLITPTEEPYRVCVYVCVCVLLCVCVCVCVCVYDCDYASLIVRRRWPTGGCCVMVK
jgi:hypothetical protein